MTKTLIAAAAVLSLAVACGTTTTATTSTTTMQSSTTSSSTPPATTRPPASTTSSITTSVAPVAAPAMMSIPVGRDGVTYRGSGAEQEITGPSLVAITDDGTINIVDPVGGRILRSGPTATSIDLIALDILSVTAMAADGADLLLIEVFFAPERQRLHRLTASGAIASTVDLPPGYRLGDGLSDVFAAGDGDVVIEFAGGAFFGTLDSDDGSFRRDDIATIHGVTVEPASPDLVVDGALLSADLTTGVGGLRYLGTGSDGRHVIERSDVVAFNPAIDVVRTIEWYSPSGELLESAYVPSVEDQAISQAPGVAIWVDGSAWVLIAAEDRVEVRRLEPSPGRLMNTVSRG